MDKNLNMVTEKSLKDLEDRILWRMFSLFKVNKVTKPSSPVSERLNDKMADNTS
jgi:hypothetical protein